MFRAFSDVNLFRRDTLGFFASCGGSEPLVRLNLGFRPVYLVNDPELIKPIFKAKENEIGKGRFIDKMKAIIGTNSLTLSGEAHRERRAAIHEQLTRGVATTYVTQISSIVQDAISRFMVLGSFDAHEVTSIFALRVICVTLFGRGSLTSGDEAVLINSIKLVEDDLADRMFRVFPDLPWTALQKSRRLKLGRQMMKQVVDRTRKRASSASIIKSLESLDLSSESLRDEILLLMLAGHHTTGSSAAWIFYYLSTRSDLVERLSAEAESIINASGDIESTSLPRASVSRSFVFEVLRLYPSSYWYSREVKAPTSVAGLKLNEGDSLIVSPWRLHRDPRFWTDPESFDIDRNHMTNKAYVPFGSGPRACVGMGLAIAELQLLTLMLVSSCAIKLKSSDAPGLPRASITLVPPRMEIEIRPKEPNSNAETIALSPVSDEHSGGERWHLNRA